MGRTCCVKNCRSGTAKDIKRRKELGLKSPVTLHKVRKVKDNKKEIV